MRKTILIAGVAALAASLPVMAEAQGRGPQGCPPGLAKKSPACVPPGHAKRLFREGQRIPSDYRDYIDYSRLPERYRNDIPSAYRTGYRYIYEDDAVYVVDPTTSLVRTIIDLID